MFWRDGVDSLSALLVISSGLEISNLLMLEGQPSATFNTDTQHMAEEAVGCGALDLWTRGMRGCSYPSATNHRVRTQAHPNGRLRLESAAIGSTSALVCDDDDLEDLAALEVTKTSRLPTMNMCKTNT